MANYESLRGRLTAVDQDAYLAEETPAAPLNRDLSANQLCAYAQGNSFVHDLPSPAAKSTAKTAAGRELRQARAPPRHTPLSRALSLSLCLSVSLSLSLSVSLSEAEAEAEVP